MPNFIIKSLNQIIEQDNLNEYESQYYNNVHLQCARISTRVILDYSLIIIMNTGQSDAANIKINLDGIPIEAYPGFMDNKMWSTIAPQTSIAVQGCVGAEKFPSDYIEITWTDEQGEGNIYRNYLCV